MTRLWKFTVAMTAAAAIAFSSVTCAVLWHLWRHPPGLELERTPEGFRWQGPGYAAMLTLKDDRMDWLMVWRRRE